MHGEALDAQVEARMVRRALDGLCVGIVTLNPAGRTSWMNRAAQRMLGLDFEESRGQLFAQVVRDPQLAAFWQQALSTEETVQGDLSLHWPRPLELKVNATTSLAPSGDIIGRAVLFCDVTAERTVQVQLSHETTQRLLDMAEHWNESAEAKAGLTAQELKILRCLGSGLSNPQIACHLHIALSTVRSHLKHLYRKLGLTNRSEAISYALRNGMA